MKSATRLIAHWSAVSLYLLSLSFSASAQMGDMEQTGDMQGMCPMCERVKREQSGGGACNRQVIPLPLRLNAELGV